MWGAVKYLLQFHYYKDENSLKQTGQTWKTEKIHDMQIEPFDTTSKYRLVTESSMSFTHKGSSFHKYFRVLIFEANLYRPAEWHYQVCCIVMWNAVYVTSHAIWNDFDEKVRLVEVNCITYKWGDVYTQMPIGRGIVYSKGGIHKLVSEDNWVQVWCSASFCSSHEVGSNSLKQDSGCRHSWQIYHASRSYWYSLVSHENPCEVSKYRIGW